MNKNIILIALCFLAGFLGCKVAERTGAGSADKALAAKPEPVAAAKVVKAEKFEIVDADGRVLGSLEKWGADGAALKLVNKSGGPRVILAHDSKGSALGMFDDNQTHRVDLMNLPSGPRLVLTTKNGKGGFAVLPEQMGFADEDGNDLWTAP